MTAEIHNARAPGDFDVKATHTHTHKRERNTNSQRHDERQRRCFRQKATPEAAAEMHRRSDGERQAFAHARGGGVSRGPFEWMRTAGAQLLCPTETPK